MNIILKKFINFFIVLLLIFINNSCIENNKQNLKQAFILSVLNLNLSNEKEKLDEKDPIVLVHGNTGYPSNWDNTVNHFLQHGWTLDKIIRPNWGLKTCATCNDHEGEELETVKSALQYALSISTTGMIDVLGHSMGATLAAKAILDLNIADRVNTFVGIAGAFRGLHTCGIYPNHVGVPACGEWGFSINSPFINSLTNKRFGKYQYIIFSWVDEIICNCGTGYDISCCYVDGEHTSLPDVIDDYKSYNSSPYGHFGVLLYTYEDQRTFCIKK